LATPNPTAELISRDESCDADASAGEPEEPANDEDAEGEATDERVLNLARRYAGGFDMAKIRDQHLRHAVESAIEATSVEHADAASAFAAAQRRALQRSLAAGTAARLVGERGETSPLAVMRDQADGGILALVPDADGVPHVAQRRSTSDDSLRDALARLDDISGRRVAMVAAAIVRFEKETATEATANQAR
jgi:hypothetical protein